MGRSELLSLGAGRLCRAALCACCAVAVSCCDQTVGKRISVKTARKLVEKNQSFPVAE